MLNLLLTSPHLFHSSQTPVRITAIWTLDKDFGLSALWQLSIGTDAPQSFFQLPLHDIVGRQMSSIIAKHVVIVCALWDASFGAPQPSDFLGRVAAIALALKEEFYFKSIFHFFLSLPFWDCS